MRLRSLVPGKSRAQAQDADVVVARGAPAQRQTSTARVALQFLKGDVSLRMGVDRIFNHANLPRLGLFSDFSYIKHSDARYNCIAWSLRDDARHIDPRGTVRQMDALYQEHGFTALDTLDFSLRDDVEKVVLYAITGDAREQLIRKHPLQASTFLLWRQLLSMDDNLEPTHAIVQERDGSWSSKMGKGPLVRLWDPALLGGGAYGEPTKVYARRRA